jgi:hypothetical protein
MLAKRATRVPALILSIVVSFSLPLTRNAPQSASAQDDTELAKKTQNPVADLISVPFQSNWNFGAGSREKTLYVMNIQPVIPVSLNENWNLITRIITPIINQPALFPGASGATGLGDINPSFFLSPAKPGEVIWGVGPTFTLPTATDRRLGSGKWSMGPTGVALSIQGPWVFGALINNQWSIGGWGEEKFNQMLLQPFVNYNLPGGWYLSSVPVLTANWAAKKSRDVWTVPLGGGVGKLFKIGKLPINTQLQVFGNVAKPEFGPDWQLRFQVQFLFPK